MEKKEKNDSIQHEYGVISNTKYILSKIWQYKKSLLFCIIIGAIATSSGDFIWNYVGKYLIDIIQNSIISNTTGINEYVKLLIITIVILVIVTVTRTQTDNKTWYQCIYVRQCIIQERILKALKLNYQKLEDPNTLDLMQKALNASSDNTNGVEGIMHYFFSELVCFISLLTAIGILAFFNAWIILFVIVLGTIQFLVMDYTAKKDKKETWDFLSPYWRKINYLEQSTQDFSYAKDIRLYNMKDWLLAKQKELFDIKHKHIANSKNFWIYFGTFSSILSAVRQCLVFTYLVYAVIKKGMSIGDFILYAGSIEVFAGSLITFLGKISEYRNASRQVDDFRSFMDLKDPDDEKTFKHLPKIDTYEFKFENVSFKYPKQENYSLKNLNITIKSGQKLAIVGLNGAGKTTFIKLLLRLYDVTEGRILLNGTDISEYDRNEYFDIFSPVFQDVNIFAFPLNQNISMRIAKDTDNKLVEEKLRQAGLSEKLDSLPSGMNTELLKIIDDKGIDFSGGEKQKLSLARALYKNAPVIILDEPTAALDALAEYKLYKEFDKLVEGKTSVYISHRLSSTRFCDGIAMFKNGELVEYGTHKSLLDKNGEYAKMFEVQAQYYKEGKTATGDTISDERIKEDLSEMDKLLSKEEEDIK